ncbi:MAG: hypothetical protein AAF198_01720 [Pseudomonadota bacterium]
MLAAASFEDVTFWQDDPKDRDDRLLLPNDHDAHFHNAYKVISPTEMKLLFSPEEMVIMPDHFSMPDVNAVMN